MRKKIEKAIELIYVGDRLLNEDTLASAFVDTKAKDKHSKESEFLFKKGKFWIGTTYQGVVTPDKKTQLIPKRVGTWDSEKDEEIWRTKSIAANEIYKNRLAKEKIRKNPLTAYELDFLRKYTDNLSYHEKKAFIEYLVMELAYKKQR